MLALCQHKEALKHLAFQYLPLETPERSQHRKESTVDKGEDLHGRMPIFYGPDQDKPWVEELHRYVHGH